MQQMYPMPDACPTCEVGHLSQLQTVYVQVYESTLVHAPHVTAWKCDLCGEWFFDPDAIRRLDVLVGEAGPPPNRHALQPARSARPADDSPDSAQPGTA